jgi:hypothetical protein
MKVQLGRDDFQKLCQDYLNESFKETVVRGIEFKNAEGLALKVSRVEVDFYKDEKNEK